MRTRATRISTHSSSCLRWESNHGPICPRMRLYARVCALARCFEGLLNFRADTHWGLSFASQVTEPTVLQAHQLQRTQ